MSVEFKATAVSGERREIYAFVDPYSNSRNESAACLKAFGFSMVESESPPLESYRYSFVQEVDELDIEGSLREALILVGESHSSFQRCGLWPITKGELGRPRSGAIKSPCHETHCVLEQVINEQRFSCALSRFERGRERLWIMHYSSREVEECAQVFPKLFPDFEHSLRCGATDGRPCYRRVFGKSNIPKKEQASWFLQELGKHRYNLDTACNRILMADRILAGVGVEFLEGSLLRASRDLPGHDSDELVNDLFICHASEDSESVIKPLSEALAKAGISYWLDRDELLAGQSVTQEVNAALRRSRLFLAILSTASYKKPWVRREIFAALEIEAHAGHSSTIFVLVGDKAEEQKILHRYPLIMDKLFLRWEDGCNNVVEELRRRLRARRQEVAPGL